MVASFQGYTLRRALGHPGCRRPRRRRVRGRRAAAVRAAAQALPARLGRGAVDVRARLAGAHPGRRHRLGAMLNVPWLALGTVLLLVRAPGRVRAYLGCLVAFSLASVALLALAPVTDADLAGQLVPEGSRFLPIAVRVLAVVGNVVGTLVVVGGAVSSGLAMRHRRELRPRFEGNLLIALGVAIAAGGGVFAFLDQSGKLGAGLALGACVMYAGFWRASVPLHVASPSRTDTARPGAAPS